MALDWHYPSGAIHTKSKPKLKKNIKQLVYHWYYQDMLSVEQLAVEAKNIGLAGVDLAGLENGKYLKALDLDSTMCQWC